MTTSPKQRPRASICRSLRPSVSARDKIYTFTIAVAAQHLPPDATALWSTFGRDLHWRPGAPEPGFASVIGNNLSIRNPQATKRFPQTPAPTTSAVEDEGVPTNKLFVDHKLTITLGILQVSCTSTISA